MDNGKIPVNIYLDLSKAFGILDLNSSEKKLYIMESKEVHVTY